MTSIVLDNSTWPPPLVVPLAAIWDLLDRGFTWDEAFEVGNFEPVDERDELGEAGA